MAGRTLRQMGGLACREVALLLQRPPRRAILRAGTLFQSSKLPSTFAVIEPVEAFDSASLTDWSARRPEPVCGFTATAWRASPLGGRGGTHPHHSGAATGRAASEVRGVRWLNGVLANVKRTISGAYHAVGQVKYAKRYLGEAAYRFKRRFNLGQMPLPLATADGVQPLVQSAFCAWQATFMAEGWA